MHRPRQSAACALVCLVLAGSAGCAGATATPITFTATQVCSQTAAGTEAKVGDVTQYRDIHMRCPTKASDPRVEAVQESTVAIDMRADQSADIWGTMVLTNDGGTWAGDFTGTVAAGYTTHRIEGTAVGTGAYEGLRLLLDVVSDGGTYFEVTGTIEPVS